MQRAPIPAADHCISYDPTTAGYYANYGGLFAAIEGKKYNFAPHAVSVLEGSGAGIANAFVLANQTLVYPISLVTSPSVTLELRFVPDAVSGFEATFPGAAAGQWVKLPNATQTAASGVKVWHVNVAFADRKLYHAAIVRSV